MAFHPMTNQKWMVGGDHALPAAGSRVPSPPDLCCMEDDGWDKDSPSKADSSLLRGVARPAAAAAPPAAAAAAAARLPTPSERAQLRRARPADPATASRGSRSPFVSEPSPPPEERVDGLLKMFRAQRKFLPAGVTGSAGSRALCHGVSPFVAERRGLFVAWEVRQGTKQAVGCSCFYCCCCCCTRDVYDVGIRWFFRFFPARASLVCCPRLFPAELR